MCLLWILLLLLIFCKLLLSTCCSTKTTYVYTDINVEEMKKEKIVACFIQIITFRWRHKVVLILILVSLQKCSLLDIMCNKPFKDKHNHLKILAYQPPLFLVVLVLFGLFTLCF